MTGRAIPRYARGIAVVLVAAVMALSGAFLAAPLPLFAQDEGDGGGTLDALRAHLEGEGRTAPTGDGDDVVPVDGDDVFFPDLPTGFEPDDETLGSIQGAVQGYYDYRIHAYEHRAAVFRWQYISSVVIFAVVVVIVLFGLFLSWMQFRRAEKGVEIGTTTLEASESGFKVSSPVLGVIILLISLAFFYLYLIHVYPIFDTF